MIRLKKMLALAIAMVMVVCTMNFAVFADETNPGDLLVNGDLEVQGLGADDEVAYYQLLKWDAEDPNGWVWGDGVTVTEGKVGGHTIDEIIGDEDHRQDGQNLITGEIAGDLAGAVKTAMTDPAGNNDNGTWTAEVAPAGLYIVIITSKTPGTMYNPIFIAANWYQSGTTPDSANGWVLTSELSYQNKAFAKKSTIPLDKNGEPVEEEDAIAEAENGEEITGADTVDVGEEVNFTVTTKIPKFASNYTKPAFVIKDTLTGLKLKAEPEVWAGSVGGTKLTKGTDYTLTGGAADATSYEIKFTDNYMAGVAAAGQDITVTYTGIVTDDAEYVVNEAKNQVDVKFSTDPTDKDGHGLLRDVTNHFSFSIDAKLFGEDVKNESSAEAIKIGVDANGEPVVSEKYYKVSGVYHAALAGAEFGLYTDEECENLYTNDLYKNGCKVTSDGFGRITIKGLDVGSYWLKEISAPQGYIKEQKAIPVVISAVIREKTVTETEGDVEVTYVTKEVVSSTVTVGGSTTTYEITNSDAEPVSITRDPESSDGELVNTKGVELPATGGMGTTIFYVIGAILVLGAGILLVTRRRMDSI